MSTHERIGIVTGDNKFELFAQLYDWGRIKPSAKPSFKLTLHMRGELGQAVVDTVINGISAEDGSGDGWIISGFIRDSESQPSWIMDILGFNGYFTGYYNTRTRKGILERRYLS